MKDTEEALRTFRAVETEKLPAHRQIISTGVLIGRPDDQSWGIMMSRHHYAMELLRIGPTRLVSKAVTGY